MLSSLAERVAPSFGRGLIKPAARKDTPRCFNAHYRGTGSGIVDRGSALEAGFGPGDIVRRPAFVKARSTRLVWLALRKALGNRGSEQELGGWPQRTSKAFQQC